MTAYRFKIISVLSIVVTLIFVGASVGAAGAMVGPAVKVGSKWLDDALEVASKVSGKALTPAGRRLALDQLRNAAVKYGDDAILAARNGGVELIEAAGKYGDDVWTFAAKVPAGARALAMRPGELLPLTRRIGAEVLELEAKSPGLAGHVVKNFGDDGVRYFSRKVPAADATRLVGYADRADTPATRRLLLDAYKKGGTNFLDKLDWKKIVATGLSAAMITGAYQVSDGVQEGLVTVSKSSPETFKETAFHVIDRLSAPVVLPLMLFGMGVVSIKLWQYYRRTRKTARG